MDEATLIEKLLKIEALFAGTATEGERTSADRARQRILKRLQELLPKDPPVEYKFTFRDIWSRKVFVTLLRRYGIKPYHYCRQRYTTVMAQLPKRFVDETLWPEFQKINNELNSYLHIKKRKRKAADVRITRPGVTGTPLAPFLMDAEAELSATSPACSR